MRDLHDEARVARGSMNGPRARLSRLLMLAAACLLLLGCPSLAKIQDVSVESGRVADFEIKRGEKSIDAVEGARLEPDDEIWTRSGTSVVIEFNSGSVVLLRPGTHVRVRNPRLFEFVGEVLVQVEGAFGVETEHVDAGAGSTEYVVRVAQNKAVEVLVLEGVVNLRSKTGAFPTRRLTRNQARGVDPDGREPAEPIALPIGEFDQLRDSFRRHLPQKMVHVVGMQIAEARKLLGELRIRVEEHSVQTLDAKPNVVISQDVSQGEKIWPGTAVRLEFAVEPPKVPVPNVVGQEGSAARERLEGEGFEVTSEMVRTVPPRPRPGEEMVAMPRIRPGTVVSQSVAGGTRIFVGSTIHLKIEEVPLVLVRSYVGMTAGQATKLVEGAGLRVRTRLVRTGDAKVGTVVRQSPSAEASVEPGETVQLYIEQEPEVALVTVPNVLGGSEDAARLRIESAGLRYGGKTGGTTRRQPVGTVIGQKPAAGSQVARGTSVSIVVQSIR